MFFTAKFWQGWMKTKKSLGREKGRLCSSCYRARHAAGWILLSVSRSFPCRPKILSLCHLSSKAAIRWVCVWCVLRAGARCRLYWLIELTLFLSVRVCVYVCVFCSFVSSLHFVPPPTHRLFCSQCCLSSQPRIFCVILSVCISAHTHRVPLCRVSLSHTAYSLIIPLLN